MTECDQRDIPNPIELIDSHISPKTIFFYARAAYLKAVLVFRLAVKTLNDRSATSLQRGLSICEIILM